ncbi:NAD-dependent epimerase/dehydratase family protein [Pararobbsia silviterrae]|uniref:NAD-dependent epimerase/dehydratase family protein n=1 Tax=Pararobbsia silviterrae TaxID=1792498 RepID=UPI001F0BBE74|nr:NAD-dependent epimerase/dehydratase family protein [Pararobbsia silviterrae]
MSEGKHDGKIALVLGATGGIGGEVAARLQRGGWAVRALHRNPDGLSSRGERFEWVRGDAMHEADVVRAAQGVSLIVHAVNPPGYRNWGRLVLPMIDNTIRAARASGARIVLPGTVYNYGPDAWPELIETSPQRPQTRKGRIRVELEARLRAASRDGVRTLIVRAGDFFGPRAASNWFAQGLVKAGKPVTTILNPGRRATGHQWAYVPDVAETMVRLIEREVELEPFATFHMDGHWDEDGMQMIRAIQRAVAADHRSAEIARAEDPLDRAREADRARDENAPRSGARANPTDPTRLATSARMPKVRAFPWALVMLASPFVTLFHEMREMRYLWREPLRMRNTRLVECLGAEPHTSLDDAVRATLESLGCLDAHRPRRGLRATPLAL